MSLQTIQFNVRRVELTTASTDHTNRLVFEPHHYCGSRFYEMMVIDMIDLHVIKSNNKYIVFHPESMSLFLVSEDIGKTLEFYESESNSPNLTIVERDCSKIDIPKLVGFLVGNSKKGTRSDLKGENRETKTLSLIISQDCNLRCSYCYADHGAFGGERKLMSIDTAKNCIDMMLSRYSNNYIIFFGGEPFLNFSLMNELEEYASQNGLDIKYTTVTNGTIMNEAIMKFITEKFYGLCISIDGPKEINDMQRFGNNKSVHDQIIETIDMFKMNNMPFSVKCTITKKSINNMEDINEYICALGASGIAYAAVTRLPQESELFISDNEFEIYAKNLSKILAENIIQLASGDKTMDISPIFFILTQLVTKTRKIHHCSAGREFIAVTVDGDVYPCHEFVGIEEFKMGNVNDENFPGESFNKIKGIFNNYGVYVSEECKVCWARFLCGGDCAVRSYLDNGDIFRPTKRKCILIKSILEAILPEFVEVFQDTNKMENIMNVFKEYKQHDILKNPVVGEDY